MQSKLIHQIRVDFYVTQEIKRYVYIYIIAGQQGSYLIDSGVDGAEKVVENYLKSIGNKITDIKAIFLTHAHPDHIGSAYKIKEITGCKVYVSKGEKRWIEDIDLQYAERPIPGFYSLVNQSVKIDEILADNDIVELEPGISIKVISTPGHSCDELSYLLVENKILFTGDTIPVKGDIPIWINEVDVRQSLMKLQSLEEVDVFYPAWDVTYQKDVANHKILDALDFMEQLKENVDICKGESKDLDAVVQSVCDRMGVEHFLHNPLFRKTILSFL